ALAAGRAEEQPDYDAAPEGATPAPPTEAQGIFAFPTGTKPGTCLHKIFEAIDFVGQAKPPLRDVVAEQLTAHGFEAEAYADILCETVRRGLSVHLDPGRPNFQLARVSKSERLSELEFFFPIERLTASALQRGFARSGAAPEFLAQLARLGFQPTGGLV